MLLVGPARSLFVAIAPVALLVAGACSSGASDAPAPDEDAAAPSPDAAARSDSASEVDAADAAPHEVPLARAPAIACLGPTAAVYQSPPGLPPMSLGLRGTLLGCAKDVALTGADIATRLASAGVTGVMRTSETSLYRIAYRTYREDGVAGISTARVYLPTTQRSKPLPVVVVAHPTVGVADNCAPSEDMGSLSDVALPWAARGFAVIAPDYAGLGNDGVQGYTANHDTAHSLLDSARALRALLPEGAFDDRVLLAGYSQGGGAVLAAHGLAASYGAGGTVVGAIVFAPEWFSRMKSFGYEQMLRAPDSLTITTGISKPVVASFRNYAAAYNLLGPASAGLTFPADKRQGILDAANGQCQTPFGGYIQAVAPHLRDLFDEGFRTSMLACIDGSAGCAGIASQLHASFMNDLVVPDPEGPPILYLQGLLDIIMPPAEEAACNLPLIRAKTQLCTDGNASHTNVVPRNVAFAVSWGESLLDAQALPTCSADGLPPCLD